MALIPFSCTPVFSAGQLMLDAALHVWQVGTTTRADVYQNPERTILHPNPVPVDGYGHLPAMYGSGALRLRAAGPTGLTYFEAEVVVSDGTSSGGGGGSGGDVDATALAVTGDLKHRYDTGVLPGWVRCNGRTIGSGTSGASERANDDTFDLYSLLWAKGASVVGGRGNSAQEAWSANRPLELPDARGRLLGALDDMGAAAAGRYAFGKFDFGNPTALGSYGGEAVHTLTGAQLPNHIHSATATLAEAGQHIHAFSTEAAGDHNHAFSYSLGTVQGGSGASAVTGITPNGSAFGTGTVNNGSHLHTGATAAVGPHTHTASVTINPSGSSEPFNVLPNFLLCSVYIKL